MTTLEFKELTVTAGGKRILDRVSFRLEQGDLLVLVGPNGAGKTTLIRSALSLTRPAGGSVEISGVPAVRYRGRERAGRIAWLPQHGVIVEPVESLELVAAARFRFDETRDRSLEAARRALDRVRAGEFARRKVTELSGGEQQRVAIAALLAQEAPLLLLDEPANHLDPAQQVEVYGLIGELWREGLGVLCITHDVNLLARAAERAPGRAIRVVGLATGRVAFQLAYDDPGLGDALESLFATGIRTVQVNGHRYFLTAGRPVSGRDDG